MGMNFQILYSMKSVFLLKYTIRFIIFKFDSKTMVYRKKTLYRKKKIFSVDYVKIIEFRVVHTWRRMQSEYMK